MYEKDYIMRLIHEMVRTVLKLLFGVDTDSINKIETSNARISTTTEKLFELVNRGHINEAENLLYNTLNTNDMDSLKTALLFYDYLNDLSDDALETANFSRDEIKEGLSNVLEMFGYQGFTSLF